LSEIDAPSLARIRGVASAESGFFKLRCLYVFGRFGFSKYELLYMAWGSAAAVNPHKGRQSLTGKRGEATCLAVTTLDSRFRGNDSAR
jgi:hypothetical protein